MEACVYAAQITSRTLCVLLLFLFIALFPLNHAFEQLAARHTPPIRPPQPLSALCNTTAYTSLCLATLSKYPSVKSGVSLQNLTAFVVAQALAEVNQTYSIGRNLSAQDKVVGYRYTLQDCLELLDDATDGLTRAVDRLLQLDASVLEGQVMDVRVWLSASLTDLDTCWDELSDPKAALFQARMRIINDEIEPLVAIALSMAQTLQEVGTFTSYFIPQ